MNRRTFFNIGTVSLLGLAGSRVFGQKSVKPKVVKAKAAGSIDRYDTLIEHQYANRIRLLRQAGGQYLGANFMLSAGPTDWMLRLGRYQGATGGHTYVLHGYWIFRPDANMCWQARNASGPLDYWNKDGKAVGNPEDWELFRVDAVSKADQTVKIYNAKSKSYIGLVNQTFACDEAKANAAVFQVEFV